MYEYLIFLSALPAGASIVCYLLKDYYYANMLIILALIVSNFAYLLRLVGVI